MVATLGSLRTRIKRDINRTSSAINPAVDDAIVAAIQFYEVKPVWFTEKPVTTLTLSSAANTTSLPADFKSMTELSILYNNRYLTGEDEGFQGVNISTLLKNASDPSLTGRPETWAIYAGSIYFDRLADQSYTLRIAYHYGDTTYPASDSDTSVWFDQGVNVIRKKASAFLYADYLHSKSKADEADAMADAFFSVLQERTNTQDSEYRLDA